MSHTIKFCAVLSIALLGMGDRALGQCFVCSDASANTTVGLAALAANSSGSYNTVAGAYALASNTSGGYNSVSGYEALYLNIDGTGNNAQGFRSLYSNTSGTYNSAVGYNSLYSNTAGTQNNATGYNTLHSNTSGSYNNAMGAQAMFGNTIGSQNSAVGYNALSSNISGSYNVGLGYFAGFNLTTGNNNIDISNRGVAGESGIIRIGTPATHTAAYISGVSTTQLTGSAVYVNSNGQLGVLASSERYKTAVAPMGGNTDRLQQLRPVTFHLKTEPQGAVQYGLIAEEVDKIYPELVIRDKDGKIQGVRYDELAPMLLNEVQRQKEQLKVMQQQIAVLKKANESVQASMAKLQTLSERVAMR